MIKIITELLSLVAFLAQQHMEKLGIKAWKIVLGLGFALISVLFVLVSICFFGCSLYNRLVVALGASSAAFISGGFFLLVALLMMLFSKKLIKR